MNKGELRTHIKDVLNRSDLSDALTDTFIEHTLTRIQRLLRIPSMERTATQTVAGGYDGFVIPNDFLEIISLRSQGNQICSKNGIFRFCSFVKCRRNSYKICKRTCN